MHHQKTIKPVAHYAQLIADSSDVVSGPPADRGFSVAIVRELPENKTENTEQDNSGTEPADKKDFLVWPDKATTGYFQLDRRMRNFAFNVSCFHNVFVGNCKPVAIESERKRACEAADYLFHISKNIKNKEQRPDFWLLFQQRLEKLKPHVLQLNNVNIKHHSQVLVLLKRLSYWWMQTCNRPIIQINDSEVADD